MLSLRSRQKKNVSTAMDYMKDFIGINGRNHNAITKAAKEYTVRSCTDNINSLQYGLDNKFISGRPYTMSELYEQAIYTERAFLAGVQWALQHFAPKPHQMTSCPGKSKESGSI